MSDFIILKECAHETAMATMPLLRGEEASAWLMQVSMRVAVFDVVVEDDWTPSGLALHVSLVPLVSRRTERGVRDVAANG